MQFRPCIDIHNGAVKQIVGGSLRDDRDFAVENFVSGQDACFYANLYKKYHIKGGHIILLNALQSEFYKATKEQAIHALTAYPQGLQVGGGMTPETSKEFLDAGASHIIVTSYVFQDGKIKYDRLEELVKSIGKERLVLDLSCKKTTQGYKIVTDRWQKMTDEIVNEKLLDTMSGYCDEFLVHAVDVEGKAEGIEEELVQMLGAWGRIPITYAGGVHNFDDLRKLKVLGKGKLHVTIGSALDLFGGSMKFEEVLKEIEGIL